MVNESQQSVGAWADQVFGKTDLKTAFERMEKEFQELRIVIEDWHKIEHKQRHEMLDKLANECADVLITLYRIPEVAGFDLQQAVNHKMKINRNRKWVVNGQGVGQHI